MRACIDVVVGSQWGDEGKGKLVDILATHKYESCCRVAGGANAGHTVVVGDKKLPFHLVPSGVMNLHSQIIIGNGVVIHFPTLMEELHLLESVGIPYKDRMKISSRAHIVFDFHQVCDGISEKRLEGKKIGTTGKGIGPTYASKITRCGVRCGTLLHFEVFEEKVRALYAKMQAELGPFEHDLEKEIAKFKEYAAFFGPMICDTVSLIHKQILDGKDLIIEGANAIMLDIDFGTYPYVTSSNPSIGGAITGLGVPPQAIRNIFGIVKAYTTRVGEGPFPTELNNELGEHLRKVGAEYGTTTGRPRRCGWLDLVQVAYGAQINNYTALCLTKLDILSDLDEIKYAVSYKVKGKVIDYYPSELEELSVVEPVFESVPGWKCDISKCKKIADLPVNARNYIHRIEEILHIPIHWVGVGADREATATL